MPLYKLTRGSIGLIVDGKNVDIEKGDAVELTEERAEGFKYLKRTDQPLTGKLNAIYPEEGKVDVVRDWSSTQDMKAVDVIDLIDETDSETDLINLREVEQKGQNRIGVMNAIKKRMGQIG